MNEDFDENSDIEGRLKKLKALPLCEKSVSRLLSKYSCTPKERQQALIHELIDQFSEFKGHHLKEKAYDRLIFFDPDNSEATLSSYKNEVIFLLRQELDRIKNLGLDGSLNEAFKMLQDIYVQEFELDKPPYIHPIELKVDDGWLAGSDVGKYGGHLIHVNKEKEWEFLINHCRVLALLNTPIGNIVVTGSKPFSKGSVYKVEKKDGSWLAIKWADLHEYPEIIEQRSDGSLVICNKLGSFLIDENGLSRIRINEKNSREEEGILWRTALG